MENIPYWMKPLLPSMHRRAEYHDYSDVGTYMVTIIVENREPIFGELEITPEPHIKLSPLGENILSKQLPKIHHFYPMVFVWKHCIMPDHIHLIIRVEEHLPKNATLGTIIAGFKYGCTVASGRSKLFEDDFNDRVLRTYDQLDVWKKYIADNPRRLAVKRANRQYFTVQRKETICGVECCIIGNKLLLEHPEKMAVIVHRHYSEQELQAYTRAWLECSLRGGVLVSAAISPAEKAVLRQAKNMGGRIILLCENGFPQYYKPAGEAFDACASGLLLQISPWSYHTEKRTITRQQCLYLNILAEKIAEQ